MKQTLARSNLALTVCLNRTAARTNELTQAERDKAVQHLESAKRDV